MLIMRKSLFSRCFKLRAVPPPPPPGHPGHPGLWSNLFHFIAHEKVQIMGGLFNIGLGSGRPSLHLEDLTDLRAPYWLGTVFIVVGIVSVLVSQLGCGCYLGFCAFMNVVGSIFSIVAIVLYAVDLSDTSLLQMCDDGDAAGSSDACSYVAAIGQRLLTGSDITLIVLSGLLLAVSISLTVTSLCALSGTNHQGDGGVEFYQPVVKHVQINSPDV